MGEAADLIIDGTLCQQCGVLIDGDSPGYPRDCADCLSDPIGLPAGQPSGQGKRRNRGRRRGGKGNKKP